MGEIEKIYSKDNRRLVAARKIRDSKDAELIFIEGRRVVEDALRSNLEIAECFVSEEFERIDIIQAVNARTDNIAELSDKLFQSVGDTNQSQGIILIAERPDTSGLRIEAGLNSAIPIVVFVKEINNPSNLGAIVRTAEAAGVAGVIVSKGSADVFSPKAIRGSMGACFRIPVWTNVLFEEALDWAGTLNLVATAADISATTSYADIDWKLPRLLIFGSEAHGLDADDLKLISQKILIPMAVNAESLNIAVSAGIILFEARRQFGFAIR